MKSSLFCCLFLLCLCDSLKEDVLLGMRPTMVEKERRKSLMVSECGEISAVYVKGGRKGSQHLEFMTLEPDSLFLPALLHVDMVSYVDTGSGKLSWSAEGKSMKRINIKRGDVYRLHAGSIFFLQSDLETERQKLRIHSIFSNTDEDLYVPSIGAYSSISDLVLGFDSRLQQSAFKVPEVVIEEMKSASKPPAIVHALPDKKKSIYGEIEDKLIKFLTANKDGPFYEINGGSKKTKTFNILETDPDFENCNGWSVTVNGKDLKYLKGSNIGVFMVNLTKGSMMGPHWNPMATEIAIVLQGEGMVRMVCPSNANERECKNRSFRVKEGDVFAIPRFYPMAQMSFNNDSFVFMGFSTSTRTNYPQFLAGKRSVLQTLNKDILALSFNVTNSTIDALLTHQEEAIILDCTSCAEEQEIKMEREWQEEEARKREEERKKEQEEERKREEQEAAERERRERERKEAEEREEEERRRREERAKREQEEARRQEEERQREQREKEEAARKEREREEEEEEEEERQREQTEKEEAARKEREREEEEEERQREQTEKEEAARKEREREEEEEEERQREQREKEEAEQRQEEELRRREEQARREQEEAKRQAEERQREREAEERGRAEQEKQEAEKRQEEEMRRREEQARREQEEAKREPKERQRKREAAARKDGEREERAREKEEKNGKEREKEAKKARKKEQKKWQEDNSRREEQAKREQEEARKQVEERRIRQKEEEDERGARNEGKRRIIAARKAWKI